LREAERLGLKRAFVSARERREHYEHYQGSSARPAGLEVKKVESLSEVL
jgi:hypothetical protein